MLARAMAKAAFGIILLVMGASVASAASLGVSPVRVTLSESQSMGALTVRNDGTEPASLQMEMLNWSQAEGQDVLTPTRELLANPPIFTVPAGGSQLVRVGLRRGPPGIAAPPQSRFYGYTNVDAHQPSSICFTQGRR